MTSVLAIIGITVTLKSGNRRRRLLFQWDVVQLVPDRSRARGLLVSYDGEEVKDPRLVQVVLKNIGPVDISSADFNDRDELEVHVESVSPGVVLAREAGDIIDVLVMRVQKNDGSSADISGYSAGPSQVNVPSMFIPRGAIISIDLLVDGPVEVYLESPLINTSIELNTSAERIGSTLATLSRSMLPAIFPRL